MHLCGSQCLRLLVIDIDIVPLSIYFNRHLTKLDELNDLFFGHAAQEDGIVLSEVKTKDIQIDKNPITLVMSGPWVE